MIVNISGLHFEFDPFPWKNLIVHEKRNNFAMLDLTCRIIITGKLVPSATTSPVSKYKNRDDFA